MKCATDQQRVCPARECAGGFSVPSWTSAQAAETLSLWRGLLKLATPRRYLRQVTVFSQSEQDRDAFLIAQGLVKLVVCQPNGHEFIFALKYPGQFIEYSYLDGTFSNHISARTVVASHIYRVNRRDLQDAQRNNPNVSSLQIEILRRELCAVTDKHLALRLSSPIDRLEALLWELAAVLGGVESTRKARLVLPLDNGEMAMLCGISESHYKAVRHDLEQTGRLTHQDRRLWILSR
jgi:CRP-like cAMP-binding protein